MPAAKSGIAALLCLAAVTGEAAADNSAKATAARVAATKAWVSSGGNAVIRGLFGLPGGQSGFAAQHGPTSDHLPAARENVDLISKLELKTPDAFKFDPVTGAADPTQPDIVPGQIADVSVYKDAAYLASWAEPSCKRGGFFSVDITDPENPEQVAFIPALPGTYHGEGTHTITLNTAGFQGDVLAVNNEQCDEDIGVGGFDLYDVSDPADPKILVQGFGDQSPDHAADEAKAPTTQNPAAVPNSAHSIFIWQDGAEAFAVIVDNTELSDVDIFNITDPRNPEFITDLDLLEQAIDQDVSSILDDTVGFASNIFLHDMVVKQINGQQIMLASYWDIGYIKVNVSDPENPVIIGDSSWGDEDPVMKVPGTDDGWGPAEGNAHQSEFSHDNKFVLASDEDFNQYRLLGEVDKGGGDVFRFFSGGAPDTGPQITTTRGIEGDTRFVGRGCVAADIPVATAGVNVAVIERGDCDFRVKTQNAEGRGYNSVVIFNSNNAASTPCEGVLNMLFAGYTGNALTIFVSREVGFQMIGAWTAGYTCAQAAPAAPREGNPITIGAGFDGWGYMHLYDNSGDGLTAVDHFAIEEASDERYALGFGDLTVHEFATDPTEDLAYSSYYAGGLRVMSFADADGDGDRDLEQVGKFIDHGGNNFWGVEVYDDPDSGRVIAASDRDRGLYLFEYTGEQRAPAPAPPVCADAGATAYGSAIQIPLTCKDVNGNAVALSIVTQPTKGTLSAVSDNKVTYTPGAGALGADAFTFKGNDGAKDSAVATASITLNAAPVTQPTQPTPTPTPAPPVKAAGACANDIAGTSSRDLLKGTSAGERILGGSGNDVIDGEGGDDCISGQNGNDDLSGDAGNDDVMGGAGTDELVGGAGRDDLDGGAGNDDLDGGAGNDTLVGGTGADDIVTGAGTDTVRGGSGNDTINARGGGRDTIDCGAGRDTVTVDKADRVASNCEVVRRR